MQAAQVFSVPKEVVMRALPSFPHVYGSRWVLAAAMLALVWACGCDHTQKTPAPVVDAQQIQQTGISNVVQMAQQHVSDPVIINQIRSSGVVYHLSAADIEFLKGNGVSDPVVLEMQATATRAPQPVVVAGQPPPPAVVGAVYVPPPPPVIGVRVGGYWR
jgi:hypothetical protein